MKKMKGGNYDTNGSYGVISKLYCQMEKQEW